MLAARAAKLEQRLMNLTTSGVITGRRLPDRFGQPKLRNRP
jgi:hypothetical protein